MLLIHLIFAIIFQAAGAWLAFCGLVSIALITAHAATDMRIAVAEAFGLSVRVLLTWSIACTLAGLTILLLGAWLGTPFRVIA